MQTFTEKSPDEIGSNIFFYEISRPQYVNGMNVAV
jgi:hypothetical protein